MCLGVHKCMNKCSCVRENKGKLNPSHRKLELRFYTPVCALDLSSQGTSDTSLSRWLIGKWGEGNLKVTRGWIDCKPGPFLGFLQRFRMIADATIHADSMALLVLMCIFLCTSQLIMLQPKLRQTTGRIWCVYIWNNFLHVAQGLTVGLLPFSWLLQAERLCAAELAWRHPETAVVLGGDEWFR